VQLFDADDVRRLTGLPDEPFLMPPYAAGRVDPADLTSTVMTLDSITALPDELLMYTDKVTMHHSLECRVPFLDLDLAAFLAAIRGRDKVSVRRGKKLQARAVKQLLPNVKLAAGKKGFMVPSAAWFGPNSRLRRLLTSSSSPMWDFFDMWEVRRTIDRRDRGQLADKHLFLLAAIALWLERNYKTPDLRHAGAA
jgi:asparagine synthase (glutamine-hydrolysing)